MLNRPYGIRPRRLACERMVSDTRALWAAEHDEAAPHRPRPPADSGAPRTGAAPSGGTRIEPVHCDRVREPVQAEAAGQEIAAQELPEAADVIDLMKVLRMKVLEGSPEDRPPRQGGRRPGGGKAAPRKAAARPAAAGTSLKAPARKASPEKAGRPRELQKPSTAEPYQRARTADPAPGPGARPPAGGGRQRASAAAGRQVRPTPAHPCALGSRITRGPGRTPRPGLPAPASASARVPAGLLGPAGQRAKAGAVPSLTGVRPTRSALARAGSALRRLRSGRGPAIGRRERGHLLTRAMPRPPSRPVRMVIGIKVAGSLLESLQTDPLTSPDQLREPPPQPNPKSLRKETDRLSEETRASIGCSLPVSAGQAGGTCHGRGSRGSRAGGGRGGGCGAGRWRRTGRLRRTGGNRSRRGSKRRAWPVGASTGIQAGRSAGRARSGRSAARPCSGRCGAGAGRAVRPRGPPGCGPRPGPAGGGGVRVRRWAGGGGWWRSG